MKALLVFILFYSSQIICQNLYWDTYQQVNIGSYRNIQVKNNGSIYLLTDFGIYKSIDKGKTWNGFILGNIGSFSLYDDKNIILSKNDGQGNCTITLLREDADTLIQESEHFVSKGNNSSVTVSKYFINNGGIYAVANYRLEAKYGYLFSNILFKNKQDTLWQKINYPEYYIYSLFVKDKDTLIVANNNSTSNSTAFGWFPQINYSFDGGTNWAHYYGLSYNNHGLKTTFSSVLITDKNTFIYSEYPLWDIDEYIYTKGIYRTDDYRKTNFEFDPKTDNAMGWDAYLVGTSIVKLLMNDAQSKFYALTRDSVFISTTDGKSWINRNNDQYISEAIDFAVDSNGIIYIISSDSIYISKFDLTGFENNNDNLSTGYELFQNYPNPFNPTTIINYTLKESGLVQLQLYNVLGQKVMDLVNTYQDAGRHSIVLNGTSLSSGIYFCKMQSNRFSATKKILLLK
ncbi:MAG: T9SS type A sorting domain-containing protein [Melioribacteraceae bacterium]|nr:T9SS type A sorting domain-containing protein [Melioribacteraceae bacterium]